MEKNSLFSKWNILQDRPNTMIDALKACSKHQYPNLYVLLQIGCLIPVTSCEAERSFSTVRRIKSSLRSTMREDRLSALVLLASYRSLPIDIEEVIKRFIQKKPRRLFSSIYCTNK